MSSGAGPREQMSSVRLPAVDNAGMASSRRQFVTGEISGWVDAYMNLIFEYLGRRGR